MREDVYKGGAIIEHHWHEEPNGALPTAVYEEAMEVLEDAARRADRSVGRVTPRALAVLGFNSRNNADSMSKETADNGW